MQGFPVCCCVVVRGHPSYCETPEQSVALLPISGYIDQHPLIEPSKLEVNAIRALTRLSHADRHQNT